MRHASSASLPRHPGPGLDRSACAGSHSALGSVVCSLKLALGQELEGVTFTGSSLSALLSSHFFLVRRRSHPPCPPGSFCTWLTLSITCTYVNGLVTCPSSPASGTQQVLISFSLSVICSLSFSIPTTVPTSDGHYDNPRRKPGGHPRMGAGIEETARKQLLLPGCLGLIEQTSLPLGALIFLSVKWDILFCLFWGLLVTDGRESAWTG